MAFEVGPFPCWEFLDCEGEVPQSRSGHTCALYKNRYLYIFGGFDGSSCFDDLYVLDLESRLWRKIEAGGDRPSGRASHSAVTDELAGVMYIFGGSGSHFGYTNKRDLCEFCFETECWRLLSNPTEDTPSARYGQSMVAYQQGLYVWGGTHGTNYPTDMYRFDLCSKQWEYVVTSGDLPCGRYRHQAMVKDDLMYIVGGSGINRYGDVFTFHFGSSVWRKILCSGTDLSDGRYAHSAVLRDGYIYLYGGNDTVRHDDLQQLDLETKVWSRVVVHGSCPPGRDFHAAVLRKDSMVIFGGSNGMRRHNDVFEFHMEPKIPGCTLGADLEALFENCQHDEHTQTSCDLFLAASDSDWVNGVYCHQHVILVRCPQLYHVVQERAHAVERQPELRPPGNPAVDFPDGDPHDNLDSLLRVVNDHTSDSSMPLPCSGGGSGRALPQRPPPGWPFLGGQQAARCVWVPIDLCQTVLYHLVNFLYSETTRFGKLSSDQLYRLFLTAAHWEVPRLAALCDRQLRIRLSMDNVLPLLRASTADGPRAQSIQEACKHFFLANYQPCTELRECEALDPRLLCELMRLHNSRASAAAASAAAGSPVNNSGMLAAPSLQLPQAQQPPAPPPQQAVQQPAAQPMLQQQSSVPQMIQQPIPPAPQPASAGGSGAGSPGASQPGQGGISPAAAASTMPGRAPGPGPQALPALPNPPPQDSSSSLAKLAQHKEPAPGREMMPPETLAEDLKRLLVEETSPDFEVVVQDEVIRVHKFLLVARSRYFASCILTSGMVEAQAGRLVIPSTSAMTADAFRALLRFLYAGDDILGILAPHTAMYLVDAASFYGLSNLRLKHFCELCVKDSFNEAHVLQLFQASSMLDVEGTQAVRAMALEFIVSNFHTVCKQPALEQLDKPLLIEILRGVAERLHQPAAPLAQAPSG